MLMSSVLENFENAPSNFDGFDILSYIHAHFLVLFYGDIHFWKSPGGATPWLKIGGADSIVWGLGFWLGKDI